MESNDVHLQSIISTLITLRDSRQLKGRLPLIVKGHLTLTYTYKNRVTLHYLNKPLMLLLLGEDEIRMSAGVIVRMKNS